MEKRYWKFLEKIETMESSLIKKKGTLSNSILETNLVNHCQNVSLFRRPNKKIESKLDIKIINKRHLKVFCLNVKKNIGYFYIY